MVCLFTTSILTLCWWQGTWDILLLKYAELGQYDGLLQLLEEMKEAGGSASADTYAYLMQQVAESDEAIKLLNDLSDLHDSVVSLPSIASSTDWIFFFFFVFFLPPPSVELWSL